MMQLLAAMTPLAILNFILCSAIGWSCLCRISVMSGPSTLTRYRAKYVAMLVAFTASGFSWLVGDLPHWPQVMVALAVLLDVGSSARLWRFGPPAHARK